MTSVVCRPLCWGAERAIVSVKGMQHMKIYLANPRGFCAGVDRAIDIIDLSLKKVRRADLCAARDRAQPPRGELAPAEGRRVCGELNEVPEGSVVIFSAHGVAKSVWKRRRAAACMSLTPPAVGDQVHNEVNRDYTQGYELILIGHAGHPEVIGTLGQIPDKFPPGFFSAGC